MHAAAMNDAGAPQESQGLFELFCAVSVGQLNSVCTKFVLCMLTYIFSDQFLPYLKRR